MTREIFGAWDLVALETEDGDGNLSHPMGDDLSGRIIFTPEGYMSATIMSNGRPAFAANDLMGGTDDEKARATEVYMSYSAKFRQNGDRVFSTVDISLLPNWIGTTQERILSFREDNMVLTTVGIPLNGKTYTTHAIWRRP